MTKVYKKLVRDKIPQIIKNAGKTPVYYQLESQEELRRLLVEKLREEVEEYCLSLDYQELADITEVIRGLLKNVHQMDYHQLETVRAKKESERGGFNEAVFLEKVID